MEKQEVKSKWDELARQLGAEISPETEQLVESVSAPDDIVEPHEESRVSTASRPIAPKRPAAGWDNLASEFGLPVPEPEVEPVAAEAAVVAKHEPVAQVAAVKKPQRERRTPERRERSSKRHAPRDARDEFDADDNAEIAKEKSTDADVTPASPREEPAKPGAAVSLWHKIFGLPAEQAARVSEIPQEEVPQKTSHAVDESRDFAETDFSSSRTVAEWTDSDENQDTESSGIGSTIAGQESSSTERRRRSRRRRGRGGKGDRSFEGEGAGRDRPRRPRGNKRTDDGDIGDGLELGDDDLDADVDVQRDSSNGEEVEALDTETGATSRSRSALQRSIPSWDEAIGYIVEVNMQSRSQRRQSSHTSSRGPSRGRPRGRRKR